MKFLNNKQFWLSLRNVSTVGAILMFVMAFVAAQDVSTLPIGGSISQEPVVGSLWSCTVPSGGGGAHAVGTWVNTANGTFDFTGKAIVDGAVSWDGELTVTVVGDTRMLTGNELPIDHTTGTYPVASNDDAYQFDRNPNTISAQTFNVELPANPTIAAESSCVPMGAIGIMKSGVVLFNALDGEARDAVAYETQDSCQGHPERSGEYHYHNLSECVEADDTGEGHSALLGYAYDGFGIYGHRGEDGEILTNEDLDECHGHTHVIDWDGVEVEMYHYHATYEYPYTISCYRGTPTVTQQMGMGGGQPQGGNGGNLPTGGNGGNPPPGGNGGNGGNLPPRPGGNGGNPPPKPGGGG